MDDLIGNMSMLADLTEIQSNAIDCLIRLADEYDIDRNYFVSKAMEVMCEYLRKADLSKYVVAKDKTLC